MSYYAVKVGRIPGVYSDWQSCQEQVKGFSKAVYKKFGSKEEAERFAGLSHDINKQLKVVDAFVDGGWDHKHNVGAFAYILVANNKIISKSTSVIKKTNGLNNVGAELKATKGAVKCAIDGKYDVINLYFDCEAIETHAKNSCSHSNSKIIEYNDFMMNSSKKIKINFHQIKGHNGNPMNTFADFLCSYKIQEYIAQNTKN